MRNRGHTIEEESFFPSITDLMVGIIFIFIIIVMALIYKLKMNSNQYQNHYLKKLSI